MEDIKKDLAIVTTDMLTKLLRLTRIKSSVTTKEQKINLLTKVYIEENLKYIYEKLLNEYEKELIKAVAQTNGMIKYCELKEIYYKYHAKPEYEYYRVEFYKPNSLINIFTLFNESLKIPASILKEINKFIPVLSDKFEPTDKVDENCLTVEREKIQDFDKIIQYLNLNTLTITEKKGILNKKSYEKVSELLNIKDIYKCKLEDVKGIEDTKIYDGIFKILETSNLIYVDNNKYKLTPEYKEYLCMKNCEKIKFLYKRYMESTINETSEILHENLIKKMKNVKLEGARKIIVDNIKKMPIDKWVDYNTFKMMFRIYNNCFLRKYIGEIILSKTRYYIETVSHYELEERYIDIVVLKYLLTLGIVDIKYDIQYVDSEYREGEYETILNIKYIKLNKKGAYVLGMLDSYKDCENDKALLELFVTDKFEIVVEETENKIMHEMYFDKYFAKKDIKNNSIYKLDFNGIINALDNNFSIEEIIDYLKKYSKNTIPNNVLEKLEHWKKLSYKVSIEKVYILKCDEDVLDMIMEDKNFSKYIDCHMQEAIVLKENKLSKIKQYFIEEGLYCGGIGE